MPDQPRGVVGRKSPQYLRLIIDYILIPLSWILVIGSYLQTEITNDVYTFLEIEKQALTNPALFGTFPFNVDTAFEMKPLGNRMLFYILNVVFPGGEYPQIPEIKIFFLILALAVMWWFTVEIHQKYPNINRYYLMTFLMLTMFTMHQLLLLQTEWIAVIFTLAAFALYCSRSAVLWFLSGIIMVAVFSLKGTTGLMIISFYTGVWLLKLWDWPRVKYSLIGLGTGIAAGIISAFTIFPHVIPDAFTAKQISSVYSIGLTGENIPVMLYQDYGLSIVFMPMLLIGLIMAAWIIWVKFHEEKIDWKWIGVYLMMWLGALGATVAALEFFPYQYIPVFIPVIVSYILIVGDLL